MDTLRVILEQEDEGGLLSRVTGEWFRMDRQAANYGTLDLVLTLKEKAEEWNAIRYNQGAKR